MRAVWSPLVAALALSGCAGLVPRDEAARPAAAVVPATLAEAPVAGSAAVSDATAPAWRDVIVEPRLARLIEQALAHNRDLRLATLNIEAARAQYRITGANRWPTVNAQAGGSASRTAADTNSSGNAQITRQLNASLGVSAWELDLWGRLGSLKDAALATYLASEHTQRSVQASLVAELAQAWLTLVADQQAQRLALQTLESRRQSLALTERRKALGAISSLDVATAQASVETARGDLATAQSQVRQDLNALRLLVGAEPAAELLPKSGEAQADSAALVNVPAGLPSSVLLRRPDVQAAELALQAAQANVAAARAAMFPTLTLTASAGTASTALSGLFAGGNSTWSFVPTLKLPIFDGGVARAGLDSARVAQQIKLTTYEQALQTAFKEAADALATRASLTERLDAQTRLVAAYDQTLQLTTRRYQAGAESSLAVLTAQVSLYSAQQALISLRLSEQANRLTLYKVLGGV